MNIDGNKLVPEVVDPNPDKRAILTDIKRDVPQQATSDELAAYVTGWAARDKRDEARRVSPEAKMAAFWSSLPGLKEGTCWTRLPDGLTVPTIGEGGPPRAMSRGEALCVGCRCGDGALAHYAPCKMAPP